MKLSRTALALPVIAGAILIGAVGFRYSVASATHSCLNEEQQVFLALPTEAKADFWHNRFRKALDDVQLNDEQRKLITETNPMSTN